MSAQVSVVIPSWNGSNRIHIPLAALAAQNRSDFEVIVVDNASTDGFADRVQRTPAWFDLAHRGISCKVVLEPRSGATHARVRGVREAQHDLVCLLDDDNAPEPGYLEAGIAAMADPAVGVLVSRIYPLYEQKPPRSILKREHLLAINRALGDSPIEWGPESGFAPTVTAGMWVPRNVFLNALPWPQSDGLLADRKGGSLACGGDIEIGHLIAKAGYKRVYVPELKLIHHIPSSRLRSGYFCRLIQGIVRSEITLDRRYRQNGSVSRQRAAAGGRLLIALAAAPVLALRSDGLREALFVLASRWAQLQGAYPSAPEAESAR